MLWTWAMFILAFKIEICSWMDFPTQFLPSLRLLAFSFLRWMVLAMAVLLCGAVEQWLPVQQQ